MRRRCSTRAAGRTSQGARRADEVVAAPATDRALAVSAVAGRAAARRLAAEATARRVIAQNSKSPRGYFALAESLEERQRIRRSSTRWRRVADFRGRAGNDEFDVASFCRTSACVSGAWAVTTRRSRPSKRRSGCRRRSGRLALSDRRAPGREEIRGRRRTAGGRPEQPDDLRLTRLQARALRLNGKTDQGSLSSKRRSRTHSGEPLAYIALAQLYATPIAVRRRSSLQDAQAKFPASTRSLRAWRGASTSRKSSRTPKRRSSRCSRTIRTTPARSTIWATCSPSAASGWTSRWDT